MRSPALLATCCALIAGLVARPGAAVEQACAAPVVEADGALQARWPRLPERVLSALSGRIDIERCASVLLGVHDGVFMLEVVLADGRSASRQVAEPEDVIPALEALLIVPPRASARPEVEVEPEIEPTEAAARSKGRSRGVRRRASPTSLRTLDARSGVSERQRPGQAGPDSQPPGVSISLVGAIRMGDGQTSESVGAMSLVEYSNWLVGFEGKIANTQPQNYAVADEPGGGENPLAQTTLDFSVLGGHRFGSGFYALDLLGGPCFVLQRTTEVEVRPEGERRSSASRVLPRMAFGGHFRVGARSRFGGFLGIEGAVGPRGSWLGGSPPMLPPLPAWAIGVALGATVGVQ